MANEIIIFSFVCCILAKFIFCQNNSLANNFNFTASENGSNVVKFNTNPQNISLEQIVKPIAFFASQNQQQQQPRREDFKSSPIDFKPSPQLDLNLEFNKEPVLPVVGEARLQSINQNWKFPSEDIGNNDKLKKKSSKEDEHFSFPTPNSSQNVPTSLDRPYRFASNKNGIPEQHKTLDDFHSKVYEVREVDNSRGMYYPKEEVFEIKNYDDRSPPYYDYPNHYLPSQNYPDHKYLFLKKAVKFLAAIIPVGLLISALSPAIVNFTPVNNNNSNTTTSINGDTMNMNLPPPMMLVNGKRRKKKLLEDSSSNSEEDLSIKRECEEKIICRLILGAEMPNYGLENVERLFKSFTKQEREMLEKMSELKTIFEAAKKGSCDSIPCPNINDEKVADDYGET